MAARNLFTSPRNRRSTTRRSRAAVRLETLETRQLLSAITEYPVANPLATLGSIAADNAGNVWYTTGTGLGKLNPATGASTQYNLAPGALAVDLAFGPDGNLWFTQVGTPAIGVMDTTGNLLAEYALPPELTPQSITVGPDGALWFTQNGGFDVDFETGLASAINAVGRITTAGEITHINVSLGTAVAWDITAGSDGALWFTMTPFTQWPFHIDSDTGEFVEDTPYQTDSAIGRVTLAGNVSYFNLPTAQGVVQQITTDAAGNFWFTQANNAGQPRTAVGNTPDLLGKFTYDAAEDTITVTEFALPGATNDTFDGPTGLVAASDGKIWFTEAAASRISRLDPITGAFDRFATPTANAAPFQIIEVAGKLFVAEGALPQIAALNLQDFGDNQTLITSGASIQAVAGAQFYGVVGTFTTSLAQADALALAATIDWGNGNVAAGIIVSDGVGGYAIYGANVYAAAGSFPVTVTLAGPGIETASIVSAATVVDPFSGVGVAFNAVENTVFSGVVATFTGPTDSYLALINWGDGQSSVGIIALVDGQYIVAGTHAYAAQNLYPVSVAISNGYQTITIASQATVTDTPLTVYGLTLSPTANKTFSGTVAYFTDDASSTATDYAASINWGDGTSSAGSVVATNIEGRYLVIGSHKYKRQHVTYSITTTVSYFGQDQQAASSVFTAVSTLAL